MTRVSKKILKALRNRDEEAFNEVVITYKRLIYGIIYKLIFNKFDAEDVLVEVFQALWDNCESIDCDSEKFHNWFITVAYNKTKNFVRKSRNYEKYVYYEDEEIYDTIIGDADGVLNSLLFMDLNRLLEKDVYKVLVDKAIKGMNFTEIAKEYNISETTVRRYYEKARNVVYKYFRGEI